jgi:leucyl aminopeptidase
MTDPSLFEEADLPFAPAEERGRAHPLYAVRPGQWPEGLGPFRSFLEAAGFAAKAGELFLLPAEGGIAGAVLGLGSERGPWPFGDLAFSLPAETLWRLVPGDYEAEEAALGFALGAYRFTRFRPAARAPARLLLPEGVARAPKLAAAQCWARDLINTPANHLGPAELVESGAALGRKFGAEVGILAGPAVAEGFPALFAVGQGSARPPHVLVLHWQAEKAGKEAPLIALCGKGVCFDSGGYDLKPSSAMLRMKKDMGGAAVVLALARLIMSFALPVRLAVFIGAVENSVSGRAMRPLDVIRTRRGLTVEIGNTDAEGRLVLADLMTAACEEKPDLLIDCATLTGAARVALGPDLPALFCNDTALAELFTAASAAVHDPVWPLPLWEGYASWLDSSVADLNNVSSKPYAGAVIGALFLQRFVTETVKWVHLDLYAWNDEKKRGRPEGGEGQTVRGLFAAIERWLAARRAECG